MDEQVKQNAMIGIIAAALVVIVYQVMFNSELGNGDIRPYKFFVGIGLGAVVGGAAYGIMHFISNR